MTEPMTGPAAEPAMLLQVFAVVSGNYEPAEVDSLWGDETSALLRIRTLETAERHSSLRGPGWEMQPFDVGGQVAVGFTDATLVQTARCYTGDCRALLVKTPGAHPLPPGWVMHERHHGPFSADRTWTCPAHAPQPGPAPADQAPAGEVPAG